VSTGTFIIGRGSSVAISPDGSQLVYVAEAEGRTQLFLRPLNQPDARPIDGTGDAADPFFSPDGRWIGFFAGENVMKVPAGGGAAITVAGAPTQRGLAWGFDDTMFVIPRDNTGVWRVPANGGTLEQLTSLVDGDVSHRWPHVLPGNVALMYTIWSGEWDTAQVVVQPLAGGRVDTSRPRKIIIQAGGSARFIPGAGNADGRIIFARSETLMAVPFDLSRLETTGEPTLVADGVLMNFSGGAQFAVSPAGVIAYVASPGEPEESELLWVTRDGTVSTAARVPGLGRWYDLAPDGRRIVRYKTDGPAHDVWIDDLTTGSSIQVSHRVKPSTWGPIDRLNAVWMDDSRSVVFAAGQPLNLYSVSADGKGAERRLTTSLNIQWPGSLSHDGRILAFVENSPSSGSDIWVLPIDANGNPGNARAFLSTPFNESAPMISPDGRWLAYQSRIQVSADQGVYPRWSPRGDELFFRAGGNRQGMAAVTVDARTGPDPASLRQLFQLRGVESILEVSPDAQRFLMLRSFARQSPPTRIHLLANWSPPHDANSASRGPRSGSSGR
jgi:serine/threonine-protein kinase